jgi:MYXO-CTERM domain-containing protein
VVAFFTTPPSDAGWAILAVGLLGLAAAWALAAQERRIRELERQLRDKEDRR